MPYQEHESLLNDSLTNFKYGFFTNEKGSSAGGFIVDGQPTRNVNIFAPQNDSSSAGYDSAENVSSNIEACLKEFGGMIKKNDRCFLMTSNYGGMTKHKDDSEFAKLLITVINNDNIQQVYDSALQQSASILNGNLYQALRQNNVAVIKGDAVVLTNISREDIGDVYVGGFSADAHPVMLFDDQAKVCGYMAASHHVLSLSGLPNVIETMVANGADKKRIKVIIGPGLGAHSYEMGQTVTVGTKDGGKAIDISEYLQLSQFPLAECRQQILIQVSEGKFLLNAPELLTMQGESSGLNRSNILDMQIDTMGYELYKNIEGQWQRITESPEECCFLFNSARRIKPDAWLSSEPGKYNGVARTASIIMLNKLQP